VFRANEILVMLDRRQPRGADNALARTYRLVLLERLLLERLQARVVRYRIRGRRSVASVIARVRANPRVLTVQRNYLYRFGGKVGDRKRIKLQYALDKLGVRKAHAMSTGRGVAIAIIDSGIDTHHPDLKGSIVQAYNAVTDRKYRTHAHGTAIAGIIGARGRIKGVAPQARLLSVRAFYASKDGKPAETTTFILLRAFD
jgi:subtilisin family serine protease